MNLRFPLPDIKVELTREKRVVESPLFDDGFYCLNQNEFSMDVEGVAWFYAARGNYVSVLPYPDADKSSIELYLNGSVYGAILHQRKIMPLHGSCFVYDGKGIMICGESGAGKSSLTASFCQNGGAFLTDDVTPVVFSEGLPFIMPLSDRIKLWDDSLSQLNFTKDKLVQIWKGHQKYYVPVDSDISAPYPLHLIFILEKYEKAEVKFQEIKGVERFTALRNEIYRWEYLMGMKESEAHYLNHLVSISNKVHIIKVARPEVIDIEPFRVILTSYLNQYFRKGNIFEKILPLQRKE